ncbi:MAG TPA: DUF6111 family protein [Caulobacteraceae bacterium]
MLRVLAIRLALFALPFAVYFVWRALAVRSGREMGSTPWPWLVAAGALLAALSLIASVVFHRGRDTGVYVPAQVRADGTVTPGHFIAPSQRPQRPYP